MAKKVTINGQNLLSNISQDWGGVNNSGDTIDVHGTSVPNGAEWGINRGEIERFIKAQFGSKVGTIRWVTGDVDAGEDANYYYIDGFAKEADIALFDNNPVTYASLRLFHKQLPISTITGDSYVARLATNVSNTPNYAVKNGADFNISLRFQSIYVIGATNQSQNYSAYGTITIERSTNSGTTWTQVEKMTGIVSVDPDDASYPVTVNLGKYLYNDRTNRFRIRASFQYNEDNVTKTRYSTYITYNIQTVSLTLSMLTDWSKPIIADSSTNELGLNFQLNGAIQKTLHICLDGDEQSALLNWSGDFDSSYNAIPTGGITLTENTRQFFMHGVHEVRAWLTCSNGVGGTITSDVMIYHLMIENASTSGADLTKPYILLQEVARSVSNFVQSYICSYSVYNCGSQSPINISMVVGSATGSVITTQQEEYYRNNINVYQGIKYRLESVLEVESDLSTPNVYLHVTRKSGNNEVDFLYESTGYSYQIINVDNTSGYAPTVGSTFCLNPKIRNNSEANPDRIINSRNNNAVVPSTWTNFKFGSQDGWVFDSDGNKVLLIPAGSTLVIGMNPFAQFLSDPASSLTMDFDVCFSNVTNEEDPVIRLCETLGVATIGLVMRPMTGAIMSASHTNWKTSDFSWQEDKRTHISINICNAVAPNSGRDGLTSNGSVPTGTLPLVRVLINGVINREYQFDNTSATEFCTAALSNEGIKIGQTGADTYIYGIRIWANQQLSAQNIVQNRIATLPTTEQKNYLKAQNDIMDSGRVSIEKVMKLGKNFLIWHGAEIWHNENSTQRGWWEFGMYDSNGQLIPELSGTICKETASLPSKGQGTTAKTYYYWNIQTKYSDVKATINVPLTDLHESITQGEITTDGDDRFIALKGGNLGKNFPLPSESFQNYPLVEIDGVDCAVVPDGWIDGNNKYRGVGHKVANFLPLAQKDVLKINYASSMQSHIIGVNRLYNDLHNLYVGKNALQSAVSGAVVAKHLEPFLFFTQASDNADVLYRGAGAWGAGKMDKPSWGYVKSAYPNFAMFEGADNNNELTDMRVPFDDTIHGNDQYPKVFYNPSEEAFYYRTEAGLSNAQKSIDFDGGKTTVYSQIDATHLFTGEYPHADIVTYLRNTWNFLFLHNPRIKPFVKANGSLGSFSEFINSESATDYNKKYWCSDYHLYRYDFADRTWVNAGLWNGGSYDVVNLINSSAEAGTLENSIYTRWNALSTNDKADYEGAVNAAFIMGIIDHAKANIGNHFVVESLKFHYVFENHFIAGTDNCSKNTYYVLVPVTENGVTVWKFQMHQDDVDTTLATDNSGLQTKPYYIDRMHPYAEDDTEEVDCLYEGRNNVLFNLCEAMWEDSLELASAMRSVLTLMAGMASSITGSPESADLTGCWGTLNKYIFDVQRYIPAMAFNEQARIRYEFPKLMGYTSDQRQVDPITQSMGDQLEAELQWMKRRLVYMASYAAFGEFAAGSTQNTGLSDLAQSFAMVMAALPNSTTQTSTYKFRLKPHQWLYPTAAIAQSGVNPHVRVAPNGANMPNGYYELVINPTGRSDDGITIYGINYYRSIGNIGDNCFDPTNAITLNGKRLTSFIIEPTVYYSTTIGGGSISAVDWKALSETNRANYQPAFRCAGVQVGSAIRLASFSLNGCSVVGGGTINLSTMSRLQSIDLRYTNFTLVSAPPSPQLTTLHLPATLTAVSLIEQPSLSVLTFQGYSSITQFTLTGSPLLNESSYSHVQRLYAGNNAITVLNLANLYWVSTQVPIPMIRWMIGIGDNNTCLLKGRIDVADDGTGLTLDDVIILVGRYGDVRDSNNDLYINFKTYSITQSRLKINAQKSYLNTDPSSPTYSLDSAQCYNGISLTVTSGNNIQLITRGGVIMPNIVWEITDLTEQLYAEFDDPYYSKLHIKQLGSANEGIYVTVKATATTINGAQYSVSMKIGLWARIPEVGDFAWSDGSFGIENETATKKLVGMVVCKDPVLDQGGNIVSYKLTVMAYLSSDISSDWGFSNQNFSSNKTNGVYDDEVLEAIRQATGNNDVFDTPIQNTGQYSVVLRKDSDAVAEAGDGFAMQDPTNVANKGYFTTYQYDTMNDFDTEGENATLKSYANTVLQAVLDYFAIAPSDYSQYVQSGDVDADGVPKTLTGMTAIENLIVDRATSAGFSEPTRYKTILFRAWRKCNVWCPKDNNSSIVESDLHSSYARGKWMLPSFGILARMWNFHANSRQTYNSSGSPSSTYAEMSEGGTMPNVSLESQKPLFANAMARGVNISYKGWETWSIREMSGTYANMMRGDGFITNPYGPYKISERAIIPVAMFNYVP